MWCGRCVGSGGGGGGGWSPGEKVEWSGGSGISRHVTHDNIVTTMVVGHHCRSCRRHCRVIFTSDEIVFRAMSDAAFDDESAAPARHQMSIDADITSQIVAPAVYALRL